MLRVTTERDPSLTSMPDRMMKPDHPRAIDAFIDYFGAGPRAIDSPPGGATTVTEAV